MDKVQIYYASLLTIGVCLGLFKHGDRKEGHYDFRVDFISTMVGLPIAGRIFGWW